MPPRETSEGGRGLNSWGSIPTGAPRPFSLEYADVVKRRVDMRYKPVLFLALLISCGDLDSSDDKRRPVTNASTVAAATDCSVPAAIPNDGIDDRAAIQAAIEANGCALLGPGVYDVMVTNPRVTTLPHYDMIQLAGGRSLRGTGPATVIHYSGDAGGSDLRGVTLTGDENLLADLTLDTTGLYNTEEQTHAVEVFGPGLRQKIEGVWFHHPSYGNGNGGDCIAVVGYDPQLNADGTPVPGTDHRVSLIATGNVFTACDRSGISVHSGLRDAVISNNFFLGTGDQDIDLEGAGGVVDDLVIDGNTFERFEVGGGQFAVSIGTDLTRKAVFSNNVLHGGALFTYNAERLIVSGNSFEVPDMALYMIKLSRETVISGNTITTTATTPTTSNGYSNAMITATHHNSGKPGSLNISGNIFYTSTVSGGILNLVSAADVSVTGNTIVWSPLAVPTYLTVAMDAYGITQRTDAILIASNIIRGPYSWAFRTSNGYESYGGGVGAVTFAGNVMRGPGVGLRCELDGVSSHGPMISYGNSGAPNQCTIATGGI